VTLDTDSLVSNWGDSSGSGLEAIQDIPSRRPRLRPDVFNGRSELRFSGGDAEFLPVPGYSHNGDVTIFTVLRVEDPNSQPVQYYLGLSASPLYALGLIGDAGQWIAFSSAILIQIGSPIVPQGLSVNSFALNTTTSNAKFVTQVGTSQSTTFSQPGISNLVIGKRSDSNWSLFGGISELIVFDRTLDDSEVQCVREFLYDKYAPPLELGAATIVTEDFCPFNLETDFGAEYQDYLWSDGSSESSIEVDGPGTYWLQVVDIFGRISSDTVRVEFPGNFIESFSLCSGTDSLWDTGLDPNDFDFVWNSANIGPSILITESGDITLDVTDLSGCTFSPAIIQVEEDDFPETASLGPDLELCSGNTITLIDGALEAVSLSWNNTLLASEFLIEETGEITVIAINASGCVAYDSIFVEVLGDAPLASFDFQYTCLGQETEFLDSSTPVGSANIIQVDWDFGDLNMGQGSNILHTYLSADTFLVEVTVLTDEGCIGKKSQGVFITPYPQAAMDYSALCQGKTSQFFDMSTVSQGFIFFQEWLFDNMALANGPLAGYIFPETGSFPVQLIVTTEGGCSDTTSQVVTVNGSPISAFNADRVCLGDPMLFQAVPDISASGPIQSYLWDYEGQSNIFQNTTYTWLSPGPHYVELTVTSVLGCADDTLMTVYVSNDPLGGFSDDANCFGTPIQFTDTSTISFGDQIQQWDWFFGAQGTSQQAAPVFQFSAPGAYNVALNVVSEAGCEDQVDRLVTVHPVPQSLFTVSPEIGEPPFTPEITNLSSGATSYIWTFDQGVISNEFEPDHAFTDSGMVFIDLQVTNNFGCTDESSISILLTELKTDLLLLQVDPVQNGDFVRPILSVRNLSNYTVPSFDIRAEISEGTLIEEYYTVPLVAGESRIIQMNSSLYYTEGSALPYICVDLIPESGRSDVNPSDNQKCEVIGVGSSEIHWLAPVPNPVSDQVQFGLANAQKGILQVTLFDALGRMVIEKEFNAGQVLLERFSLDLSNIEPGRYVMRMTKGLNEKVYQIQVLKD